MSLIHVRGKGSALRSVPPLSARGRATVLALAALCMVLVGGGTPASADEAAGEEIVIPTSSSPAPEPAAARKYRKNDDNDWKFYASINPWFLFVEGDVSIKDNATPIDVTFGNLWGALHMAMMADIEVQKGKVGLFTDISFARLWTRQQDGFFNFEIDPIDWVLFDFALYYEAWSLKLGSGPLPPRLRLQPFIGGRYQHFGTRILVRPTPNNRVFAPASDAAAPILGLRAFLDIDDHWNLSFIGDGGGFGVDGVQTTWQAELLGGYRFHLKYTDFGLLVGYKAVGFDLQSATKEIDGNLIYHGPVLKLAFEF